VSDERPRNSSSRVFFVVMVAGALVFGLAVGYRLGTETDARVAPAPSLGPITASQTAAPTPSQSPTRTPEGTVALEPPRTPLINREFVADALRNAYYTRDGGGGAAICYVADAPVCHAQPGMVFVSIKVPLRKADFEQLFDEGPAVTGPLTAIVVVEDINAYHIDAQLFREDALSSPLDVDSVTDGRPGSSVNYLDLSGLDVGRSLLIVQSLEYSRAAAGPKWINNVVAFDLEK
jgi:hypothetical protein